jgi:hypothetical protein
MSQVSKEVIHNGRVYTITGSKDSVDTYCKTFELPEVCRCPSSKLCWFECTCGDCCMCLPSLSVSVSWRAAT